MTYEEWTAALKETISIFPLQKHVDRTIFTIVAWSPNFQEYCLRILNEDTDLITCGIKFETVARLHSWSNADGSPFISDKLFITVSDKFFSSGEQIETGLLKLALPKFVKAIQSRQMRMNQADVLVLCKKAKRFIYPMIGDETFKKLLVEIELIIKANE